MTNNPEFYMELALSEARKSGADLPVGCVIKDGKGNILSKAHNKKELLNDVSAHSEILGIKKAEKKLQNWRLEDCEMFVTLEPCPMCAWAILNSRIKKVYFGSYDTLYGALGSKINLAELINSKLEIKGGILEEKCDKILKDYFKKIRKNEKETR